MGTDRTHLPFWGKRWPEPTVKSLSRSNQAKRAPKVLSCHTSSKKHSYSCVALHCIASPGLPDAAWAACTDMHDCPQASPKEAWALHGPKLSSRLNGVVFSFLFVSSTGTPGAVYIVAWWFAKHSKFNGTGHLPIIAGI